MGNTGPSHTEFAGAGSHGHGHGGQHVPHITPFATYMKVFWTLIALTVVTVAAARVDFGFLNSVVAFGIASVKAFLVLAYFMHLKYENMLNRVIIASAVFFLIVLYFFATVDEATRVIQTSPL